VGVIAQAVEILASAMATDFPSTFEEKSCIKAVGADMTKNATAKIFQQTGLSPQDVQVIELHDCFSCNEVLFLFLFLSPPSHRN
jgi:sterol carrier protein 2